MGSTLTIDMEHEVLALAEQEARARHTTLAEVVRTQLGVMAQNWKDSHAGKTPVTDSLRGAVTLPPDFSAPAVLAGELQKKHGRRG